MIPAVLSAQKHILVVDDTPLLRDVVRLQLERLGYRVTTANDGQHGLETLSQDPGDFDAVILDIQMPRLNGLLAWKRINALRPGLPTLFWSTDIAPYLSLLPTGRQIAKLSKPVQMSKLVAHLEAILRSATAAGRGQCVQVEPARR